MSVIVKGMDMPKNCKSCPLSEYRNTSLGQILDCKRIGTVGTALRDTHDVLNRRHPNCPLVELPPHGRLIDTDKLKSRLVLDNDSNELQRISADILKWIDIQETVIEAEGETDA